ncbi:HAAS signaling domain-containing protein [Nocardioides houyundeii]|uniref:HAAS signaling domain-containing protein n=1 Tax=Nocardioides houyundeii TaxID=2045452 RepID=UPI000DF38D3F|nr:hypothetical protein [Nocardioides houyundeii]
MTTRSTQTTTLTDRYVHAATRALPEDRRDDIGEELHSTVDDMVQARVREGSPDPEREALVELGDPRRLAARYTDERLMLIGPTYYLLWKRVLTQLLTWVPLALGVLAGVRAALEDDATVGTVVVEGLGSAAATAIQIAFWVTAVFAVLDRTGAGDEVPEWTPEDLAELPTGRAGSISDSVASIGFHVVVGAVLVLQHFRSLLPDWAHGPDGRDLPVLDPELWTPWIVFLLVALAAGIGVELWKVRAGWTWPVTAGVAVTSLAFAAPVVWLCAQDRLLNPEFVRAVSLTGDQLGALNQAIIVGAVVVAAWEIGEAGWRTATGRRAWC